MSDPQVPAIVPAAGESRRMGRPKMLLPFQGRPLIARVVRALSEGGAAPIVVVAPPQDSPEGPSIAQAATEAGAVVISPTIRPPEMRRSVEIAMGRLRELGTPSGALLTPGDAPGLTPELVRRVLDGWRLTPGGIAVAVSDGRRVHPTVLPWDLLEEVERLPEGQGVNAVIRAHAGRILEIPLPMGELADDLDTPADLDRWKAHLESAPPGAIDVTVRLFAIARQRSGRPEITVSVSSDATVGTLREAIGLQHPELADLSARIRVAVDDEFAADDRRLAADSRIALIPPVSGGGHP